MDFTQGFTASFYATFIDPGTWVDMERFEIVSGSISRTGSGLRQNAELVVREYDQPIDRYIRIYMDVDQEGARQHVPLFTGIASTPGDDRQDAVNSIRVQAYSPLKDAEDIKLQLGYYVPAGMNGARAIRDLLKTQKAPVEIDGEAPALEESIIAESNEDCVTMIERILQAINWKLQITGDGTIRLSEREKDPRPVVTMSPEYDVIEKNFQHGRDWFSCPNVLRVSSGDQTWTEVDNDPNSELSTVSRGREVQEAEDNVTLADNEGLIQYSKRRLKELQQRTETAAYTRRFLPEVNVDDCVRINYDELQGLFMVESQSIALTTSGQTQENVKRTI